MTSTGELMCYLEWVKNFRIVSVVHRPAEVYNINIHVGCTGPSPVCSIICIVLRPGRCTPWPVGHTGRWGVPFRTYIYI